MIYDRLGDILQASNYYKKCIRKCETDETQALVKSQIYVKSVTNFAVTKEKLGKRDEGIKILENIKKDFNGEVRILNNLGILEKRSGHGDKA